MDSLLQIYFTKKYTKSCKKFIIPPISVAPISLKRASHLLFALAFVHYKDARYLLQDVNELLAMLAVRKRRVRKNIDLEVLMNTLFVDNGGSFGMVEMMRGENENSFGVEGSLLGNTLVDSPMINSNINISDLDASNINMLDFNMPDPNISSYNMSNGNAQKINPIVSSPMNNFTLNDPMNQTIDDNIMYDINEPIIDSTLQITAINRRRKNKRVKLEDEDIEMDRDSLNRLKRKTDTICVPEDSEGDRTQIIPNMFIEAFRDIISDVEVARDESAIAMNEIGLNDITLDSNFNCASNFGVNSEDDCGINFESVSIPNNTCFKTNHQENSGSSALEDFTTDDASYNFGNGLFETFIGGLDRLNKVKAFYALLKMAGNNQLDVNQSEFLGPISIEIVN